jgi:spore coat polysaccharide biosynthesis protein SpsF
VREWPHGLDCESFLRTALDDAAASATDAYDREHVTPWIKRHAAERSAHLPGPGGAAARQRWTLDYPEDLAFLRALWDALPRHDEPVGWRTVMQTVERHPEIANLNAARAASA